MCKEILFIFSAKVAAWHCLLCLNKQSKLSACYLPKQPHFSAYFGISKNLFTQMIGDFKVIFAVFIAKKPFVTTAALL